MALPWLCGRAMAGESWLLEKAGSGMLIIRWNEVSRAFPVLALKSNYLDRWLNDWSVQANKQANKYTNTHAHCIHTSLDSLRPPQ